MAGSARLIRETARSAAEIAGELRREFEVALQARFGTQAQPDPVLATLFHALAVQIARVYDEAETVFPLAVLDDLIDALGLPERLAAPAQTVVRFTGIDRRELLPPETQLVGFSPTGDGISFLPDESIELAPTELVFAAVYENGRLQLLPGAAVPGGGPPLPPVSAPAALGPAPLLFLAFRPHAGHLRGLSVYIEATPPGGPVAAALLNSPWQLLSREARVVETGVLTQRPGRGGVRRLEWLYGGGATTQPAASDVSRALSYEEGAYGSSIWLFPPVPADREFTCPVPAALAAAVERVYPAEHSTALQGSWAWVQIPLPAGLVGVASSIQRVAVHCVTASNIEVWNEQVAFDRSGSVVALRPEGNADRHFMGVLAVTGEAGGRYVETRDLGAPATAGRYRQRQGRLELQPARGPTGRYDTYAMLRLLYCDAARGNNLAVGDVRRIATPLANLTAQVSNLTVSRGGAAPAPYAGARLRFAELLRTRERLVTTSDIEVAVRAFDARVRQVRVSPGVEVTPDGVRRVQHVTLKLDPGEFSDPAADIRRLCDAVQDHLQERVPMGVWPRVRLADTAQPDVLA